MALRQYSDLTPAERGGGGGAPFKFLCNRGKASTLRDVFFLHTFSYIYLNAICTWSSYQYPAQATRKHPLRVEGGSDRGLRPIRTVSDCPHQALKCPDVPCCCSTIKFEARMGKVFSRHKEAYTLNNVDMGSVTMLAFK